ncbi:MAG: GNAT family N-acetyltransferase [Verrucomicrobia bacterium]|nr:GNAT family N-acetyltransferase [Verrucomicrobiota bacterium]
MIAGEKVRLRALQEEDAEDCWRWFNTWEMVRNLEIRYPVSRLAEREFIANAMKPQADDKVFAIEALDGGAYLGNVGLHRISWEDRRATFGIFIGEKAYWGKGYGTDATRAIVRFAFEQMNLNRVDLQVLADNERGIRCYEKVGFVREGVQRQHRYREGRYVDMVVMSILREEYETRRDEFLPKQVDTPRHARED